MHEDVKDKGEDAMTLMLIKFSYISGLRTQVYQQDILTLPY